jgi:hypothetical protein
MSSVSCIPGAGIYADAPAPALEKNLGENSSNQSTQCITFLLRIIFVRLTVAGVVCRVDIPPDASSQ